MAEKRKPGAPKGNHNAFKHGFYSQAFRKKEQRDFALASDIEGVDEEIALLRIEMKKALTGGDTKNLVPCVKTALALEKLIRTDYKINGKKDDHREALKNFMKRLIIPLGGREAAFGAIKAWCGYDIEKEIDEAQKTNNGQDEANLP